MDYTSVYTDDDDDIITWIKEFTDTLGHHDFNEPYNNITNINQDGPSPHTTNINQDGPSVESVDGATSGDTASPSSADRLDHDDIGVLRCVVGWCVEILIVSALERACYGCSVNHPSQRQHTCLYEPDAYHYDTSYNDICMGLFKPTLPCALGHAMKMLRGKMVSEHRIMGAVDVIVSEWRSEPYIIEKLRQIRESVLSCNTHPIVVQCVQMWRNDAV